MHIVFDSDLNLETLIVSKCERTHGTRPLHKLSSPEYVMPKTLCREFILYGECGGERFEILSVENNRKRAYDIEVSKKLDALILKPIAIWGDAGDIRIISFDFC